MTPREKAEELVVKMMWDGDGNDEKCFKYFAIECALIAVDEILNLDFNIKCDATERCVNPVVNYWQEVKQEIEKL